MSGDNDGGYRGGIVAVAGVCFGLLEEGTYVYSTIFFWEISTYVYSTFCFGNQQLKSRSQHSCVEVEVFKFPKMEFDELY